MKPGHEFVSDEQQEFLYKTIATLKSEEEVKKFFLDLCTPAEIQIMVDRLRVVPLIKAEKPYRKIYEETGVSVTTIGRVARCLLSGHGGYDLAYKRWKKMRK